MSNSNVIMRVTGMSVCRIVCAVLVCMGVYATACADDLAMGECAKRFPDDAARRLQCYDIAAVAKPQVDTGAAVNVRERSYLTKAWNLDNYSSSDPSKLGRLQPYRQNYLMIRRSNRPDRQPSSPLPDHNVATPYDWDVSETKFQFSFKADIGDQVNVDWFGIRTVRVWAAYTQQSWWQMFNTRNSSPFRETNYEPELIATIGTLQDSGLKLINFGWEHQSNGKPLPESRSWNRLYLQGGWEWNDSVSFLARGWWRIPESASNDDNPDITDYVGRADIVARWEPLDKSQAVALLLRNNLSGAHNRSFVQLDWATPQRFGNAARFHLQITSGYGESLIDYNYRQTTVGLGFSFREW